MHRKRWIVVAIGLAALALTAALAVVFDRPGMLAFLPAGAVLYGAVSYARLRQQRSLTEEEE